MSQMDLYRYNRAIIIHRDEMNGYGLTVSGDNPVSVQTIKRGGAADVAGIREGDIIIKVNGTPVQHMNHTEVVDLIRSAGAYVTLSVRPADMSSMPGTIGGNGARSHHLHAVHDRKVTAPLPANHDAQVQMMSSKWNMLQTMHDKVVADVSRLNEKYKVSGNPKDLAELDKSRNQLMGIQKKMTDIRQPPQNLQLHSPTPFNATPQSHHSVLFHPTYGRADHPATNSGPVFPPGQRNRNPLSVQSVSGYPGHRASWEPADIPPPLPPRSVSQSFSSADHPPTYAVHDPEFHESGTHLFHSNSTNTHSSSGYGNKAHYTPTNTDGFSRSQHFPGGSLHGHGNQQPQTHHRTKSSPDPVSMQKALMAADEAARRADSVSDLSKCNSPPSKTSGAWDLVDSNRTSPPGSPPPPYGKHDPESGVFIDENHAFSNVNYSTSDFSPTKTNAGGMPNRTYGIVDIMSMEEDDGLYPRDVGLNSSFSQFNSLTKLMEHNAHLAVFMNYVIDNRCDPSSLLFYLITGMYINEGNIKEMKRWAYEIHSTFTAPGAPLLVPHVDENIAKEIDDGLVHECDKEEMMRRVFRKARNKAKEEINKQLEEFSTKLTAGLGTMFGPPDRELEDSLTDKVKEQRIIEAYLLPRLEQLYLDFEKSADDRILAIANASATVVQKQFNIRSSSANSVLEKYSAYVSKEKSVLQKKLLNKHKKVQHNGHHFQPLYFYSYMNCNLCCKLLWGVGPQGFQCLDCNMNVHRHCLPEVTDTCVGTERKKDKGNEKFRKFKPIFRDREQKRRPGSIVSGKTWLQDGFLGSNSFSSSDADPGDRSSSGNHNSSSNLKGIDERRPDTVNEENFSSDKFPPGEEHAERHHAKCERYGLSCGLYNPEGADSAPLEPRRVSAAGVTRSESCKERVQKKQPREKRKHSDPNLTSKSSDADLDNQRHLSDANNSGSSSTSSISRSLESPSTSLELVNPSCQSSTSLPGRSSETPDTSTLHSGLTPDPSKHHSWHHHSVQGLEGDSDIEIEQDPPDLAKIVPEEALARLDRREKKRQEVLNELCHTERSHVRNLKVLDRLFHRPIRQQQLVHHDVIHSLFSNLENMLDLHEKFNNALKNKRKENPIIEEIGSLLLETFDGDNGTYFKNTAAFFCSKQQIGLELLKERRRKDPSFHAFLADAESNPMCRRLQISDMIPMAMQRLTKYPLLFENLCNCTPSDTEEYKKVQRAVELSKEILNSVNHEKKEAENRQRLIDIQRRLDKSSLEKNVDKAEVELRNLDFTTHRLIYEGPLRWRMSSKGSKQKSDFHDVHGVLLDDMVALLLKDNERLVLKMHNVNFSGKTDRVLARPIIKLQNLRPSEFAAEKRAFFLVNTASSNIYMYELWCSSSDERNRWLQHIKEAVDDYKTKQEASRRDVHPPTNIPTIAPEPDDKLKDVSDSAEGQAAGASESNNGEASGSELQGSGLKVVETGDGSFSKDASPAPPDTLSQSNLSPSAGNATQSDQSPKNTAVSPSPNRRKGEFLRVTESSPLIDPSEVVVATRDVQFATPVVSKYEEIKRIDASVGKFLDDKSKLLAKLSPLSPNFSVENNTSTADSSPESSSSSTSQAKQLVTACIQEVDQLGRHLAGQKVTSENLTGFRDPVAIHKNLSNLLAHLLIEIQRRDEDSEARRQELNRLREQNHGYQERLQVRNGSDRHPSPARITSPTLSPSHSRPNSFLSLSSSSDQHEEDHGGRISADPKDSRLKTTSGVPDPALKDAEGKESKANGHGLTCGSPNEFSSSCRKISAVLEEQKSMKDNIIITNEKAEDEATKGRGNLLEDAEADAKLS